MAADMDAVDARVRKAEAQWRAFGLDASAILPKRNINAARIHPASAQGVRQGHPRVSILPAPLPEILQRARQHRRGVPDDGGQGERDQILQARRRAESGRDRLREERSRELEGQAARTGRGKIARDRGIFIRRAVAAAEHGQLLAPRPLPARHRRFRRQFTFRATARYHNYIIMNHCLLDTFPRGAAIPSRERDSVRDRGTRLPAEGGGADDRFHELFRHGRHVRLLRMPPQARSDRASSEGSVSLSGVRQRGQAHYQGLARHERRRRGARRRRSGVSTGSALRRTSGRRSGSDAFAAGSRERSSR